MALNSSPEYNTTNILNTTKNHSTELLPHTSEPLTTVGTTTNSIFGLQHPQIYTLAKRKDDIEILPGTIHPIAKTSLPISAELSSRSQTKNSIRTMCVTKYSTGIQSKLATPVCPTSNKPLTVTTSPSL